MVELVSPTMSTCSSALFPGLTRFLKAPATSTRVSSARPSSSLTDRLAFPFPLPLGAIVVWSCLAIATSSLRAAGWEMTALVKGQLSCDSE